MERIKVLLADDQRIMRDGLKTILTLDDSIEVVGTANDGAEAVALAESLNPDVILMDIRMPNMDGVEATGLIKAKHPGIVIVILTTFDDDDYIINALTFGASGYLLKDIDGEQLVKSVHDAKAGNLIMPGKVAAKIVARMNTNGIKSETVSGLEAFSQREMDIIRCMVEGKSNQEISETLFLTEGTVKNYVSTIYSKIYVTNRANAILHFKELGM